MKIMENEENRGIIDKKVSEYQLASFSLRFCIESRKEKKARGSKEQARKSRIK